MINIFRNQLNAQYLFAIIYMKINSSMFAGHAGSSGCVCTHTHTHIHIHTQVSVYKTSSKIVDSCILMSCTPCRRSEYAMGTVRCEVNVNV